MIKVSVVMPVLNGMPYFPTALESVRNQTLQDIEIIIVDAGSTDGTIQYIDEHIKTDPRLVLLHSQKKSTGYQYNMGIDAARGEYIGFCESDDYCDSLMFETLYERTNTFDKPDYIKADIVDFSESEGEVLELNIKVLRNHEDLYNKVLNDVPYRELVFRDQNHWNGIYKKSFLKEEEIKFNETPGAAAQDAGFVSQTLLLAKRRLYINEPLYHYRQDNPGSSMKKNGKGRFSCQEMIFILSCFSKPRHYAPPNLAAVVDRYFEIFMNEYGKDKLKEDMLEYEDQIIAMRELLLPFYESNMAKLSTGWYMRLFLHDGNSFISFVKNRYMYYEQVRREALQKIHKNDQIVIFGAGEMGECMYLFLINNGLDRKILFCDNKKCGQSIRDHEIYSVEEVVKNSPSACYVITNSKYYFDMRRQLWMLGIREDNIVIFDGICGHDTLSKKIEWHDLEDE